MAIIGYKGTYNFICRDLRYSVGETYNYDGTISICNRGYHFCLDAKNVLNYYKIRNDFKLLEIEAVGQVINKEDKSVTDKIKILREINDFNEIKTLLGINKPTEILSNLKYFSSLNNFDKTSYYVPVNWTNLGIKLDNRVKNECFDIIRSEAGCSSEMRIPVVVVNENKNPKLVGRSGGWFTKTGIRINHPSAYSRKGWSSMEYRCSTLRVEVGLNWIIENNLFERMKKFIDIPVENQAA